jgi:hypothetical protein
MLLTGPLPTGGGLNLAEGIELRADTEALAIHRQTARPAKETIPLPDGAGRPVVS